LYVAVLAARRCLWPPIVPPDRWCVRLEVGRDAVEDWMRRLAAEDGGPVAVWVAAAEPEVREMAARLARDLGLEVVAEQPPGYPVRGVVTEHGWVAPR
jgi:hypothetical protein